MKMKLMCLIAFVCLSFFVSRAQDSLLLLESKKLMASIFDKHKSESDVFSISNKVVDSLNFGSKVINSWEDLIVHRNRKLPGVLEFKKIMSKEDRTDFVEVFKEVTGQPSLYSFITDTLRWSSIFPNYQYPKQREGLVYYSYPVFTKDYSYALIYEARDYGGEIVVFQKCNNGWKAIARGIVWVS